MTTTVVQVAFSRQTRLCPSVQMGKRYALLNTSTATAPLLPWDEVYGLQRRGTKYHTIQQLLF